ncbi:MAG: UPF0182 family protein [Gemmatimonadetes bacterium]|nr:UPF0182 family protein [Gemmatimonadota bacterium]
MRRWVVVLAISAALTLLAGRWLSGMYADWAWYTAHGAESVWRSALMHGTALRVGGFAAALVFAFLNFYALRRSIVSLVLPRRLGNIEIGEAVSPRNLLAFVVAVSVVVSLLLSAPVSDWTTFALARIAGPFREMDPYLDRDISYVVAWLPFALDLQEWAARAMVVVSGVIVVLYTLTPSLRLSRGDFYVSVYCRRHFAVLASLGLLLLAWRSRLDALALTSIGSQGGNTYGAYEHHVGGPLLLWLSVITFVAALLVLWAGWNGHSRLAVFSTLAVAIGGPVVELSLPLLTGRSFAPAELSATDRPYASTRRLFTRRAFGVDEIESQAPRGGLPASPGEALAGISVWDPAAIARSVAPVGTGGLTAGRLRFAWRGADDGIRAAAIVPPGAGDRAWGLAEIEGTATDDRGRPVPALPALPAERPTAAGTGWPELLVYPGADRPVVIGDTAGHIPAPSFDAFAERIAHAWNARSPRLAFAEHPAVRPRIVFRRDVRDRISALVPFLTVGPTLSPLIRGDSLYWVVDLFTIARAYPLSERLMFAGQLRPYVHRAATAFVHAGTGRVTFAISSGADAIMRTWVRRFPEMFVQPGELAPEIVQRQPPATDWASLQATAMAQTGIGIAAGARAAVGTDNADADLIGGSATLFALPGLQLAWSAPLVDASGVVVGSVLATGGSSGATSWVKSDEGDKWTELLDALQRSADSAGIGRQRRNPRRGRVVTVPLATGLMYVQSHYEWGTDGAPSLAGVAAVRGGLATAGGSLREALGLPAAPDGATGSGFRSAVDVLHRRMQQALRQGDWTAFGAAFTALERLLRAPGP